MKQQRGVAIFLAVLIMVSATALIATMGVQYIGWRQARAFSQSSLQARWIEQGVQQWSQTVLLMERGPNKSNYDSLKSLWAKPLEKTSIGTFLYNEKSTEEWLQATYVEGSIVDVNRFLNWRDTLSMDTRGVHTWNYAYKLAFEKSMEQMNFAPSRIADIMTFWKSLFAEGRTIQFNCAALQAYVTDKEWQRLQEVARCSPWDWNLWPLNINTADLVVLKSVLPSEIAQTIVTERQTKPYESPQDAVARIANLGKYWNETLTVQSNYFEVSTKVTVDGISTESMIHYKVLPQRKVLFVVF